MSRELRLNSFARAATKMERDTGLSAWLATAQWALESAWGEKESGQNNFWGVTYNPKLHKGYRWCPTREVLTAKQIDALDPEEQRTITSKVYRSDGKYDLRLSRRFASFPTPEDGITAYVALMNKPRYAPAFASWRESDKSLVALNNLIDSIAAAGYATDPGYAKSLKAIAEQANVTRALAQARADMKG